MDESKKINDLSYLDQDITLLVSCLNDLQKHGNPKRVQAFWNIVTYGRMVTFHLQKALKGIPDFESWYESKQKEMKEDELLQFFKEMRNKIEKERLVIPSNVVQISHLNLPNDLRRFGPPPPGAKGFFIGDQNGGSGWIVEGPEGDQSKFYVDLPRDIGKTWMTVDNIPKNHLGKEIIDSSLENVCRIYVRYLKKLVTEVKENFGSGLKH